MAVSKVRGEKQIKDTANLPAYPEGYITTLHPEGSFDGTKQQIEKRELIRPSINFWKAAINVLIPLLLFITICQWNTICALIALCLYFLISLRRITIWFIRVYQRYAPEDIRLACVFEPSCSEYMILCLKKYGIIRGFFKGVNRLRRCHYPNGGEDYP